MTSQYNGGPGSDNGYGGTPQYASATIQRENTELIKYVLNPQGDLSPEIVLAWLNQGQKLSDQGEDGKTVLHHVYELKCDPIIKVLKENYAEELEAAMKIRDDKGKLPANTNDTLHNPYEDHLQHVTSGYGDNSSGGDDTNTTGGGTNWYEKLYSGEGN